MYNISSSSTLNKRNTFYRLKFFEKKNPVNVIPLLFYFLISYTIKILPL